jgi:Uma2 family endonuclease
MGLVFLKDSGLRYAGDAMTPSIFSEGRPMSEAEFLALGETPERVELFDGSLHVTPAPNTRHQHVTGELFASLRLSARRVGLRVLLGPNVRLASARITIPDLVITSDMETKLIINADTVRLVCEIISPSNATTDKVLKMRYYAEAEIPWYLLVEQETGALRLYQRADEEYQEHSVTMAGDLLQLTDPVVATIDPAELLPPD